MRTFLSPGRLFKVLFSSWPALLTIASLIVTVAPAAATDEAVIAKAVLAETGKVVTAEVVAAEVEATDAPRPQRNYYAYVCAESEDIVSLVRFGPQGIEELKQIEVGSFPAEIEGPHGINLSRDGSHWYVSIAHGQPFGSIHKYSTGDDEWQGDATVGMFPATLDISPTTGLLYVVNADFYGDMVDSTISVVETQSMTEVDQIETGIMPHGARLSKDSKKLYSVNMMSDELVEVDALRFEILRRLPLGTKTGTGMDHTEMDHTEMNHAEMNHGQMNHGQEAPAKKSMDHAGMMKLEIEPSWVSPPTSAGKLYIAALTGSKILEVDVETWKVERTFNTSKGPYNLAVSPDSSQLVVTYKKSDSIGFWDLETGTEVAKLETTRRIPHGVVITDDGKYSFVTVEGVGGEPGVVEVFDNHYRVRVATLEIGKQAGGIPLWQGPR